MNSNNMLLYNNNTLLTELNKFVEIWNAYRTIEIMYIA